jgi:hypothetical protein
MVIYYIIRSTVNSDLNRVGREKNKNAGSGFDPPQGGWVGFQEFILTGGWLPV